MQNFMLNLLKKKNYLKTIIIPEACWTLKIDGAFWSNLKYLNNTIGFAFHLSNFNSYIPLLSVMTTLHYHKLYQISSLEANLSLEDMKQLCVDRSHIHTGRPPKPQN